MATTSAHQLCIEGVQTDIQALITAGTITGLGIATGAVYKRKLPTDRNLTLAAATPWCIVVSYPADASEQWGEPGTNQSEDLVLPVQVSTFWMSQNNLEIDASSEVLALAREKILLRYHNKMPFTATGVYSCKVQPGVIVSSDHFLNNNTVAGALVLNFYARKSRT